VVVRHEGHWDNPEGRASLRLPARRVVTRSIRFATDHMDFSEGTSVILTASTLDGGILCCRAKLAVEDRSRPVLF
jgi:hypothetical protein